MNKELLRSIMTLHGDGYKEIAEYLGISVASFTAKINESTSEFKQGEIQKIIQRYNLSPEQVDAIFFAK